MDNLIRAYLNVDDEGNVIETMFGNAIIPTKPYDYFFMFSKDLLGNDEELTIEKCANWQNQTFNMQEVQDDTF